jgi:uncharacterized protein
VKIGVLSDTHGLFEPQIEEVFAGVEHILHAGDVGRLAVLDELRGIAPVTAVLGNVDYMQMGLRDTELVALGGMKFLLHHIVNPQHLGDHIRERIAESRPDVVVFGHTHAAFDGKVGGVRFFNPGSAGPQRFTQPRSVAVFEIQDKGLNIRVVPL